MKRTLTTLILTFGLGSLFLTTPASAQRNPAEAAVPFAFVVSGKTMPAGTYNVSQFNTNPSLFTVRNKEHGVSLFANLGAQAPGNPSNASLTFVRSGGQWVLARITPPYSQTAYTLPGYANQRNMNLKMAAMVTIALK